MNHVAKDMEHWHALAAADQEKRFDHLWDPMVSEAWLTHAWAERRTNQGSRTPGIDRRTPTDIDPDRIRHLSAT